MDVSLADTPAQPPVEECPVLRALGAFDRPLLSQGAEGRVFRVTFLQRDAVAKQRFSKKYRHPDLDARLTKQRLQGEARALLKARRLGVATPVVYYVDTQSSCLYLEFVGGPSVKQHLRETSLAATDLAALAHKIGRAVATLHDGGLVHGDLTTSNMIIREGDQQLLLIDFGLAYTTNLAEDKAVDLYVLERAITSAHSSLATLFEHIVEEYKRVSSSWKPTLTKFAEGV